MRYQLLGPFDVFSEDGHSLALGGERQRALFALLALHPNEVVSVDRIVDALWDEDPPPTASNVIQVYVSRLRRILEPDLPKGGTPSILLTRRPGYLLRVVDGELDSQVFSRQAQAGHDAAESGNRGLALSLLSEALDMWRGEALADFAYEDFARAAIGRLDEERLNAWETLIDVRLDLGEHDHVVSVLEGLLEAHPFNEKLWYQMLLALYRAGRQADALRGFQAASAALLDTLGIDPGPELQDLEHRILNQDPALMLVDAAPTTAEPARRPSLQSHLVSALGDAVDMVVSGRSVLVRLLGPAPVGISRLMDQVEAMASDAGLDVQRARAFEADMSHDLNEQMAAQPGTACAVLLGDAHFADPTTIGKLRLRLLDADPTLVVVGQMPRAGRAGQALNQLATTGVTALDLPVDRIKRSQLATVVSDQLADWLMNHAAGETDETLRLLDSIDGLVSVEAGRIVTNVDELPGGIAPPLVTTVSDLDKESRLIVEACAVARVPLSLDVLAGLLAKTKLDLSDCVDDLVMDGYLDESERGIGLGRSLASGRLLNTMSTSRRSSVAEALLPAWAGSGSANRQTAFGWLAAEAGQHEIAADALIESAQQSMAAHALGDAQPALEAAVVSLEHLGQTSGARWGDVHLALAECHRMGGWPKLAADALAEAVAHCEGPKLVDAWGWASQVASDSQDPELAEWRASLGQAIAFSMDEPAKAASLQSLHGRILNRLGFPDEADACSRQSQERLAAFGAEPQRYLARYNQAWIEFDRGHVRAAENLFAQLLTEAPDSDARRADLLAWQSRSLFKLGKVHDAIAAASEARRLAVRTGDLGPVFLSYMALAEGATQFRNGPEAVAASNQMLGLVLQQLPAWENAARSLLAKAHLANGDVEAARDEAANAIDLCPGGIAGRRWRLACESVAAQVAFAGGDHSSAGVDATIHDLLAAQWNEAAVDLMVAKSHADRDPKYAEQATGLAVELGLAAAAGSGVKAVDILDGYLDPVVRDGAERLVRQAYSAMPAPWADSYRAFLDSQPNR